ncbi:hypothetical protein BDE02_09G099100 [Populus trichocarpa]|nr:hypothetical protein BDE02_09G099100 [Populus trichocarpa]
MVIDHISYAVSDTEGDHTLIACFINSKVILGSDNIEAPVLFEGVAHTVNAANSLVLKVISASPAACSANPKSAMSSPPELTGSAISLATFQDIVINYGRIQENFLMQQRSKEKARFISGVQKPGSSTKHVKSGNEQFLTELNKWIFHDGGHLKAVDVRHHEVGEADEPAIYRIKDELEYSVEIYVWSGASCEPYVADDVQVQFYMMSPYVLKTLSTDTKGLYFTSFKVPDVYGVFQFKMECQRLGCSSLSLSKQVVAWDLVNL